MSIGTKIFELRTAKNLSQGDLADILDVSRQSVSKWETDASIPDLVKLIRMCDLFDVTLDELACRNTNEKEQRSHLENTAERERTTTQQKIIGYILLTVSLLAGIIVWLFAENESDLDVPIPIIAVTLACSLICLFVKQKAGYWCAWAIAAPLVLLSPHLVGLPFLTAVNLMLVVISVIMAFVAKKLFVNSKVTVNKKNNIYIISYWAALITLRIIDYIVIMHIVISSAIAMFPFFTIDLITYVCTSLLLTYTVCYINSIKCR